MFKYALFAAALAAGAAQAAPRDQMLVTSDWLAAHANDANLVILHAGHKAEYDAKHIPGAVLVSGDDIAPNVPGGLYANVPAPEELRKRLQALGISDRSRIVVYSSHDLPYTTRVLFTLDAAGLGKQAALLDGGLRGWEREGRPTTAQNQPVKPGVLSPLKMKASVVDADFIQTKVKAPAYDLIDARAPVFYDGVQQGMAVKVKGHLPGARNIPFNTVTDASGKLKPASELQAIFRAAGVAPGDKIAVYCHIGYQATAVIYAARTLGIDAVLYDGSFQDWAGRGLPVETAAGK